MVDMWTLSLCWINHVVKVIVKWMLRVYYQKWMSQCNKGLVLHACGADMLYAL